MDSTLLRSPRAAPRLPWHLLALAAIAAFAVSPVPDFWITLASYAGINALVALGLVVLTGVAGMTSFGQAAFVGVGAYASALMSVHFAASPWLGLAVALAVTAVLAAGLGALTMKLSGHFLPIGTLAWGVAIYYAFGTQPVLGKFDGLSGLPPITLFGLSFASGRLGFVLVALFVLGAAVCLSNLLASRVGRALHALRAAPLVAESCGASTPQLRLRAFVLAALLAALAGWLYAHTQRAVNPTPFGLSAGITYLFMTVIGGPLTLGGAVAGATLVTGGMEVLKDWLPRLLGSSASYEGVALGVLTILLLQRLPDGLWPALRSLLLPGDAPTKPPLDTGSAPRLPPSMRLPARMAAPKGQLLLDAQGLSRAFGGLKAVADASLQVHAGEIVGLIGPNGAGKSTLFNLVSGVLSPDAGSVRFMDRELTARPPRDFAAAGMARTFQHVKLLPDMGCADNAAMGAWLRGRKGWLAGMARANAKEERSLRAEALRQLQRVGLGHLAGAPAGSLALGQQRILEIARALAGDPALLLLDEPAAGLRHGEKQALARLLVQLRGEGMGILIVEHDMDFLMPIADRITVLQAGAVIAQGPPEAVRRDARVIAAYMGVDE